MNLLNNLLTNKFIYYKPKFIYYKPKLMQIKSKRYYTIKQKSRITKFHFVFEKNEFKIQSHTYHVNIFDLLLIRND